VSPLTPLPAEPCGCTRNDFIAADHADRVRQGKGHRRRVELQAAFAEVLVCVKHILAKYHRQQWSASS
jgi:hypothetical protein